MYYHDIIRNLIINELIKEAMLEKIAISENERALYQIMTHLTTGGLGGITGALGGAGIALPLALLTLSKNPRLARNMLLFGAGLGGMFGVPAGLIVGTRLAG